MLLDACPSLEEYRARGGGRGLERALSSAPEAVIEEVERSGLRGRGGAGFPTGVKWRTVRTSGAGTRYAVCNAAEGEPATFKDRLLMRRNPYQVLEGLAIAAYAVGATTAYVGLKRAFEPEAAALTRAAGEMRADGLLTGLNVDLVFGPDHYLLGEETGLLRVIEGNDPLPRVARPFMEGLFATAATPNPTLVNNVETLANVAWILAEGAAWLRRTGTQRSPGTMCITVCGDVVREGVFEVPLGTPLARVIEDSAGGPAPGRRVKAVFPGASSALIVPERLDLPLDFDEMRAAGTGLGAGGFHVVDDATCMVRAALAFSRFLYVESCAQCPSCKSGSGEISAALEQIERGEGDAGSLEAILNRAGNVTDGQKCALPTGEQLLALSLLGAFASELRAHLATTCPDDPPFRFPKLVDYDEEAGRFTYDETYAAKQPDWSYATV